MEVGPKLIFFSLWVLASVAVSIWLCGTSVQLNSLRVIVGIFLLSLFAAALLTAIFVSMRRWLTPGTTSLRSSLSGWWILVACSAITYWSIVDGYSAETTLLHGSVLGLIGFGIWRLLLSVLRRLQEKRSS